VLPVAGPTTQVKSSLAAPTSASPATWSQTFAATADQVRLARRGLAAFLNGWPLASDAVTCLSELVTNAIEHSESSKPGGSITVRALLTGDWLHVAVQDQGGPWRQTDAVASTDPRGRGLHIVAALADGWGKAARDGSRTVWFIMTCPEPAPLGTGRES
jgi:anti-sigma regulatory factor (Ser/Thr protein kinase)